MWAQLNKTHMGSVFNVVLQKWKLRLSTNISVFECQYDALNCWWVGVLVHGRLALKWNTFNAFNKSRALCLWLEFCRFLSFMQCFAYIDAELNVISASLESSFVSYKYSVCRFCRFKAAVPTGLTKLILFGLACTFRYSGFSSCTLQSPVSGWSQCKIEQFILLDEPSSGRRYTVCHRSMDGCLLNPVFFF